MMAHDNGTSREVQSHKEPGKHVEYVTPAVDIYETDTGHVLLTDLPGVTRDGLDISVEQDRLTIRGRVGEDDERSPEHKEFKLRSYYRSFTLADEIDTANINATLTDGVLRLELPKSARAQARKIPVTIH